MTEVLVIKKDKEISQKMVELAFSENGQGGYKLDDWIFDHLDLVTQENITADQRIVSIHLVPYTVVDDEIVYFSFAHQAMPSTIYVSFPIVQDDFVAKDMSKEDLEFSFAKTIIGKIIRVLDQPHIGMQFSTEDFKFPAIIDGEMFFAFEVKGENNVVVDELAANLGAVNGRVTQFQIINDDVAVSSFSKKVANYATKTTSQEQAV